MIKLEYPEMLDLFSKHIDPAKRSESASFLIWYLENYFRLDELEAVDSVCDQKQDKGIDGIYYSEGEEIVYLFQSKISQKNETTLGDKALREFAGTLEQVKTKENIDIILNGTGNELLKSLIRRLGIRDKIDDCEVRGIFVTNIEIDTNGVEYLKHCDSIQYVGKSDLLRSYVPVERNTPIDSPVEFDLSGFGKLEYTVDTSTKCYVVTLKAKDLVKLQGIQNQSLFDLNVRGPLGKTKVNRDIEATLKTPLMHKTFPMYHNGITIICNYAELDGDRLAINKYYVVNGCQSLTVLHRNSAVLTDDLRVLVRIVRLDTSSDL